MLKLSKGCNFEGKVHQWIGSEVVTLEVDGIKVCDEVILVDFRSFGVDMMLGMNSIKLLGGVSNVNGILCHVKHIRPRNDTRLLCIVPDIEIEVGTDTCHGNAENHEEQIEDVLERQEEDVKAESGTQEVDVPLQRSARERRMPSKYLNCYLFDQ